MDAVAPAHAFTVASAKRVSISARRRFACRSWRRNVSGANGIPHASIDARTGTRGISVSSSADTIPGDSDAALARNATSAASATAAASADPAAAACALFVASPPSFHRAASRIAFSSRSPLNVRAMSSVLCHAPLEPHASVGASGRRIHAATRTSTTGAATTPASVPSAAPIARSCGLRSMVTFRGPGVARIARTVSHRNPRLRESREAASPPSTTTGMKNVASGFDGNATAIPSGGDAAGP